MMRMMRMPEERRRSVLITDFQEHSDVQSCSSYRGMKLSHAMKI